MNPVSKANFMGLSPLKSPALWAKLMNLSGLIHDFWTLREQHWSSVTAVSDHVILHCDPNGQLAWMWHAGICTFCWPYVCIKDKLVCSSLRRQSAQLYAQLDVAFQLLADSQCGPFCCMELGTRSDSISGSTVVAVLHVLVDNGMAKRIAIIPSMPIAFSFGDVMLCRYEIIVTCQALTWWGKCKWRGKDDFTVTMVSDQATLHSARIKEGDRRKSKVLE